MTQPPSRNVGVTIACPVCSLPFAPVGRQRVCSPACCQAVWRRRHALAGAVIPPRASRAATIYECPSSDTRYLGEQRCPECAIFCQKVGPGALCPHCDEPVLLADLLQEMEGGGATLR
ncbi:MAG: hypothetical protein HW409_864 [candidate division NC10 bacterium]|nr:hypothetical protein [candidate division NC10 bacterium]